MTKNEAIQILDTIPTIGEQVDALEMAIKALEEQKVGRWLGHELGECSVCGHEGCASDIWDGCEHKYCPNCGCRMIEPLGK